MRSFNGKLKMNKRNYLVLLFLVLNIKAIGQSAPNIREEIIQKNKLDYLEREKNLDYDGSFQGEKSQELTSQTEINVEEGYKFRDITILGNEEIKKSLSEKSEKFLGKNINNTEIYNLLNSINNEIYKNGYITSSVIFKEGNIYEGKIILEIVEGKINEIYFNGEEKKSADSIKIATAFPSYKEKLLNIRDLDQGIENLNNSGWIHRMEIVRAKEGYSDIVIYRKKNNGDFSLNYDNSPIEKAREKLGFSYQLPNPLSLNDSLNLSYSTKLGPEQKRNKENIYDLSYSIPYGSYKFLYNLNITKNHTVTNGINREITRDVNTIKQKFKLEKVISRGESHKTTANIFLNIRDKDTHINKQKIGVQSKKYATTGIALNHFDKLWGGSIFLSLQYEKGVPWFGAEGDSKNSSNVLKKEFDKFSTTVDWRRRFPLKNNDLLEYRFSLGAAYSNDATLDIYKFSIGDEYTVRGFKKNGISGEKGIYINNTLSYRFNSDNYKYLHYFTPFIGLDFGKTRDKSLTKSDSIVGGAIGLKFNNEHIHASLTYGIPLKHSKFNKKEENTIYFSIGYSF